jgi:hypothetical protein
MNFRSFTVRFFVLLIVFVGLNALIWFGWTREITDPYREAGDLLRIGYVLGHVSQRQNIDDLPKRHIKIAEYNRQPVDLLTVGDSFSVGGGQGRNSHYQDYIASLQGLTVLNVPFSLIGGKDVEAAPIVTLSKLINSGYLDVIKPKYLLLESVERYATRRFTVHFPLRATASVAELDRIFREEPPRIKRPKDSIFNFINNGNWQFIANNLQYMFRDTAHGSMIIISRLNRRLFSSSQGDQLIFYTDDIKNSKFATPASMAELNQNLNQLAAELKAKGITLIFMPIVDKLNLYEPHLREHRYPKSVFFEELRKLPKDYLFIDTKEILSRSLEKGEMDLYHQDDSHWSWKASEAIFSTIRISEPAHASK